jgi:hypothetical protein
VSADRGFSDYWEIWRVDPTEDFPDNRPRNKDQLTGLLTRLKDREKDLRASGKGVTNPATIKALKRDLGVILIMEKLAPLPVDDVFASFLDPEKKITQTGTAFYIDKIREEDLPTLPDGKKVFTPGGHPRSGLLESAPYTGAFKTAIDAFLAKHKNTTSRPVVQWLTGELTGRKIKVTGSPPPTGLPPLKLPE